MANNIDYQITSVDDIHKKYADLFDKSKRGGDLISTDTFFKLLMAEMTNQDPLEPTSNTEFVSQMAQFTALQAQQNNLTYTMNNYASGLIGKTLRINEVDEQGFLVTGRCTAVNIAGEKTTVTVNGKNYNLTSVKGVISEEEENAASPTEAYTKAVSLIGKEVVVKMTDDDGNEYFENGTVDAVEVEDDGSVMLVINNYVYSPDEVVYITNPTEKTEPAETEEVQDGDTDETMQQILDIAGG